MRTADGEQGDFEFEPLPAGQDLARLGCDACADLPPREVNLPEGSHGSLAVP